MSVDSKHKQYTNNRPSWDLTRDCDAGSNAIKKRAKGGSGTGTLNGEAGTAYLPPPNATDTSEQNRERYYAYRARANFVNFVSSTREGLTGLVFRRKTEIDTSSELEYLIKNANGAGLSTDQMIKAVTDDVLLIGRHGLLVDYPQSKAGLTVDQVKAQNLRANIIKWKAESILNWRTEVIGSITKLTLVVLYEPREVSDDGFKFETKDFYRVLKLEKSIYTQQIYDADGNTEGDEIIPKDFNGKAWNEIPFTFVGSINNDPDVDKAPLFDIASINISHYQNSADFEESSFMVGQPTPALAGLSAGWVKDVLKGKIGLGSHGAIMLPVGGSAELLQANENQMPSKGMELKELQMMKIGARLIQDTSGNETVDAAKVRFTGQNSKLSSIIQNVESAFIQCYAWASMFMGGNPESTITINKEFYDATIDPQMVVAQIQLVDRGVIAVNDLRDNLRTGNLIKPDRTNDDIEGDAETIAPLE